MCEADLLTAAANGDVSRIAELVTAGADPNAVHPIVGHSALYNATYRNQLSAIRELLARGADPNLRLNYLSPVDDRQERQVVAIMFALTAEAAILLLNAGADVNAADETGTTPLLRAVARSQEEVVRTLLDAGADAQHKTKNGRSATDIVQANITEYQSWVVEANRSQVAEKVQRLERIREMLNGP